MKLKTIREIADFFEISRQAVEQKIKKVKLKPKAKVGTANAYNLADIVPLFYQSESLRDKKLIAETENINIKNKILKLDLIKRADHEILTAELIKFISSLIHRFKRATVKNITDEIIKKNLLNILDDALYRAAKDLQKIATKYPKPIINNNEETETA